MSASKRAAWLALVFTVSGCGAGAEPAKPVESAGSESTPAAEAAPEAPAEPSAPAEPKEEAPQAEEAPASDQKPRDVTYTQSPEGLKVDVAGMRFLATAAPVRSGDGWGVKVKVKATSKDGESRKLLSPKNGPLAFAGKVDRAGKVEELSDERSGEEEKTVAEKAFEFSREWPGKSGVKPLMAGEKLELEVGLWGLGEGSALLRPVRQFLVVKMVAGKKQPQPIVSPPASAAPGE